MKLIERERYALKIAITACKAILYEVCVTPKPGLVDRNNSGAHRDMDIFTFIDSAMALTPHFRDITLLGMEHEKNTPPELFDSIRKPGMLAEKDMLNATKGVNTHKGAIFSIGIICAAIGYMYAKGIAYDTDKLSALCAAMSAARLKSELEAITLPKTAGEAFFLTHRITGVRGEAASGFKTAACYGLPALKKALKSGNSLNNAGVIALLSLMMHADDTNLIKRTGKDNINNIRRKLPEIIELGDIEGVYALDDDFIAQNISPGGCADLLAVVFMLYFMEPRN